MTTLKRERPESDSIKLLEKRQKIDNIDENESRDGTCVSIQDNETIIEFICPEEKYQHIYVSVLNDDESMEEDESHASMEEDESSIEALEDSEIANVNDINNNQTDNSHNENEHCNEHHHDAGCCNTHYNDKVSKAAELLLKSLISPLNVEEFLEKIHKKKCLVTHNHDFSDLEPLLDLSTILEESASDSIHVWIGNKNAGNKLESISVEADVAERLWETKAASALYFRASEELEDFMCMSLSTGLGMNFAQSYLDGARRGEIETFVSRKGHVTGWHFDFQHNFTFQLQGSKRWYLKKDPKMIDPIRGATPHYATSSNYDEQMKVNRMLDPNFERSPSNIENDPNYPVQEVVLKPGSVLYFPAGMWHKVETVEESISINVSLTSASWGDVVTMAFNQILMEDPQWRNSICGVYNYEDAKKQLDKVMSTLPNVIEKLMHQSNPIPAVLFDASESENETQNQGASKKRYRKNVLASIFPAQTQESDDSINYSIHVTFGNENLQSLSTNMLTLRKEIAPMIDFINQSTEAFTSEDLHKVQLNNTISIEDCDTYLEHFVYFGVIVEDKF